MNKTKILIVEDEVIVALDIKNALRKLKYEVTDIVTNYDDALLSVKKNKPDIILMDINLKNSKDGIDTAIAIQKKEDLPIIYLTAFSDEKTIDRAIETNPISYLLKPFKRDELKSTILLSIYKINQSNKYTERINCQNLGFDYYFDSKNKILFYKDTPIKLSVNERKLLTILVDAKGSTISFENLEHLIWSETPVSNSALRTLIYRLRIKLEYKLIETVQSVGCKLTTKL